MNGTAPGIPLDVRRLRNTKGAPFMIEPSTDIPGSISAEPIVPATPAQRRRWTAAYTAYTGFTSITFTNAVWVIYLATHGYSAFEIGLLETWFHLAKFIAEVPTGAFADIIGRRASLIISNVLGALDQLCFLFPTPPLIILSFALSGISFAFRGGAGEAILWSIVQRGEAEDHARYSRLFSAIFILTSAGQLVGAAIGGILGDAFIALPFLCQIAAYLIGAVGLLPIPEQRGVTHQRGSPLRHILTGWRLAWRDPILIGFLLVSGIIECIWATTGYYSQLFLHVQGFSLALIGILASASMAVSIGFTAITPPLMRRFSPRTLVVLFFILGIVGVAFLCTPAIALYLLGFVVLTQATPSVLGPAISTYVNARAPEAQRATILSFQTALFSLSMVVLFPLFGLGVTHTSYQVMYFVTMLAMIGAGGAIALMVWWRGKRRQRIKAA
jgi:MFS family permease